MVHEYYNKGVNSQYYNINCLLYPGNGVDSYIGTYIEHNILVSSELSSCYFQFWTHLIAALLWDNWTTEEVDEEDR